MRIGPHALTSPVLLAPMAGVTDAPFRQLCLRLGAGLAASEMVSANADTWRTEKSKRRLVHLDPPVAAAGAPRVVQIAGGDPESLAAAARHNLALGAEIIDVNMGCPCKKVCNKAAGSALLRDEDLVARILDAVVRAVPVPVTLKIRTGWDRNARNGVRIARLAEAAGVQALAVHGRTRADMFEGEAEYDTIRDIKRAVGIPVVANGDIDTPEKAAAVLAATGADAVMIGRAAQGRPWIFREVAHFLATGERLPEPGHAEVESVLCEHLEGLYALYGVEVGVRVARKHIGWYLDAHPGSREFRACVMTTPDAREQLALVRAFLAEMPERQAA
jgi:tRNA-dihydrouridine synthase B